MAFQLPASVQTNNPVLLHEWAGPFTGANATAAKAAANAYIPAGVRLKGLEVTLIIAGTPAKYWYQNDVADSDLIAMPTGGGGGPIAVLDEGVSVEDDTRAINFTGAGVTATLVSSGLVQVDIPGGSTPTITNIDLNYGNYSISTKGVYFVSIGTDYSATVNKIFFPDPSSFVDGDEIVIINKDTSNGLSAAIDTESFYPFYQGSEKAVSNIPWNMMYIFKKYNDSGGNKWYCTPPTAQPTYDIDLVVAGTNVSYTIKTNGIYTVKTNTGDKASFIEWPNPVDHNGQEITIINNSDFFINLTSWTSAATFDAWLPIYNTKTQSTIRYLDIIPVNSTYTFLSNGEFWYLKSSYPVITNITDGTSYDLNGGNIQLPHAGIYYVVADDAEYYKLKMPLGNNFLGQSITIINTNTNHPLKLDGGSSSTSIYKRYNTQLQEIRIAGIVTVNNILGTWYVLDGETY